MVFDKVDHTKAIPIWAAVFAAFGVWWMVSGSNPYNILVNENPTLTDEQIQQALDLTDSTLELARHRLQTLKVVEQVNIRTSGTLINMVEIVYTDGTTGMRGENRGDKQPSFVIDHKNGEFISTISGRQGTNLDQLCFGSSKGRKQCYGGTGGDPFEIITDPTYTVIDLARGIGKYASPVVTGVYAANAEKMDMRTLCVPPHSPRKISGQYSDSTRFHDYCL